MRKKISSKRFICLLCLLLTYFFIQTPTSSQAEEKYPTKPIRFIVPMSAGGGTDTTIRKMSKIIEKSLGQEIIVQNKPGSGGLLAASYIAKSKPDGYTIGAAVSSQFNTQPFLLKMGFDPLKDLDPIVLVWSTCAFIGVKADSPIKTFEDFIEEGRKRQLLIGVTGMVIGDIALQRLAKLANLKLKLLPFGGTSKVIPQLLGGHVDAIEVGALYKYWKAGTIRLLVRFNEDATEELKAIPHFKDFGYNINAPGFAGIFAPAGLPRPIHTKLEEAYTRAANDPSIVEFITKRGSIPNFKNSKNFDSYNKDLYERSRKMWKKAELGIFAKEKK